jgi:hypothetical protein
LTILETPSINAPDSFFFRKTFDCPVILVNQHIKTIGNHYTIRCDQEPGIRAVFDYIQRCRLFPFLLLLFKDSEKTYSFKIKEELFLAWKREAQLSDNEAYIFKFDQLVNTNAEVGV